MSSVIYTDEILILLTLFFPICALFCCTNEDDEKRGKFHLLTILYHIYTVGKKDFLDEIIVLDD